MKNSDRRYLDTYQTTDSELVKAFNLLYNFVRLGDRVDGNMTFVLPSSRMLSHMRSMTHKISNLADLQSLLA